MQTTLSHNSRALLRTQMRKRRRNVSSWQQRQAANSVAKLLRRQPIYKRSQHIAFYLANDGEVSLQPLMADALHRGKACYLPAINGRKMEFVQYLPEQELTRNRFGILQPQPEAIVNHPQLLDLVLMPLVAFDSSGNRLGMGGGYYDRYFSFKKDQPDTNPQLLGVAHDFQEVGQLTAQYWDIPLDGVVTSTQLII